MRSRALVVAVLAGACSTAAPEEQDRFCVDDSDCQQGQICSNSLCYENELPPREPIALDVRTDSLSGFQFRIEFRGEDRHLTEVVEPPPVRFYVDQPDVRDRLLIRLKEWQYSDLIAGEKAGAVGRATLELQEGSRLGRAPFVVTGLNYPPKSWNGDPAEPPDLIKAWPHYHLADEDGDQPLYLKLTYEDDAPGAPPEYRRGIVARQLARAGREASGDQAFEIETVRECHRKILGSIRFPEGPLAVDPPLDTPPTVKISMRHAGRADDGDPMTPICDPAPLGETPATCAVETIVNADYPQCSGTLCPEPYGCYPDPVTDVKRCGCKYDHECPKGQVCNVEQQKCALDLADRLAIKDVTADAVDDAAVASAVYIYCDADPSADRTMEFIVRAEPDARLGLPRLNYRVVLTFLVGDLTGSTPLGRVCLPTWERARAIDLPLVGKPATLYRDGSDRAWTCCDTSCLSGSAPPAEAPGVCPVRPAISVVGEFAVANPSLWEQAACMPLSGADDEGKVRVTYPSTITCPEDSEASCNISLSPGAPGGDGQTYTLRVEPPVGSLFRSATLPLTVTSDLTTANLEELQRRVLLRGRVCQGQSAGGACEAANAAEVVAERVIRGEDPDTLLGPYFYSMNTMPSSGDYVIPVNPGVYLVTALPSAAKNSDIGPAPIVVVDLREGSPLLVEEDGVLVAEIDDLKLKTGWVYTLELNDFDSSSRVIPLDVTSWVGLTDPDGEVLDLNAPGTCQPSEGCQIRRVRSAGSPVRLPQDQIIRYVARAAASG